MTASHQDRLTKTQLLTDVLQRVSRSFYLTLTILPAPVRDQIGLAYLFARAADTITDTDLIEQSRRLELVRQLKAQFDGTDLRLDQIRDIQEAVLPHQVQPAEQSLVEHLSDCFAIYQGFSESDRQRIGWLMQTLIPGMEMDLTKFAGGRAGHPISLETMEDLDRYIYHVAGCVGEFWTRMICAHIPRLRGWEIEQMAKVGVRFGKGLQLTNVLKDIGRDVHRGRCYVPGTLLKEVGVQPQDLLEVNSVEQVRPVLTQLIRLALEHLDQGWLYTLAIPRSEVRLRLACMWPILFAGQTLRRVAVNPDLLDPAVHVKMPKSQVKRIMAGTIVTAACGSIWTAYWGRLRKQII